VYSASIENEKALRQHILYACQTVRNRPGTFENVRQSTIRPVYTFIESDGGYFEHLL
jgi:hypothetical protein